MRARSCLLLIIFSLFFSLSACTKRADPFAPFLSGFQAELCGKMGALEFSGMLCADAVRYDENGAALPVGATFTFYAPASLSGIRLTQNEDDTRTLTGDTLCVPVSDFAPFRALFAVFSPANRVERITKEGQDTTRVQTAQGALLFDAAGTPLRAECDTVLFDILNFEGCDGGADGGAEGGAMGVLLQKAPPNPRKNLVSWVRKCDHFLLGGETDRNVQTFPSRGRNKQKCAISSSLGKKQAKMCNLFLLGEEILASANNDYP